MLSPILAFYRGGRDDRGRTLDEILRWNVEKLETTHDYIQWLFPLEEPSGANPSAPVLRREDVAELRADPAVQGRFVDSLRTMLRFYGLELAPGDEPAVRRRDDFPQRAAEWITRGNHNFLRLTRILRSLRLAGLEPYARALHEALAAIHRERPDVIGAVTCAHWNGAMTDPKLA